jgi:DNA-binding Xre family transcriptional regulator
MQYDYERFLAELGARVKQLRKERGLTHRCMISDFGFHLGQLARIEKGEGINAQTLLKLCAALDVTLEDLVRGLGRKISVD